MTTKFCITWAGDRGNDLRSLQISMYSLMYSLAEIILFWRSPADYWVTCSLDSAVHDVYKIKEFIEYHGCSAVRTGYWYWEDKHSRRRRYQNPHSKTDWADSFLVRLVPTETPLMLLIHHNLLSMTHLYGALVHRGPSVCSPTSKLLRRLHRLHLHDLLLYFGLDSSGGCCICLF